MEYEIRATFSVTIDATVEANSTEHAETVAADYISNECNFTVEQFDEFHCTSLQFDDIDIHDVNEQE